MRRHAGGRSGRHGARSSVALATTILSSPLVAVICQDPLAVQVFGSGGPDVRTAEEAAGDGALRHRIMMSMPDQPRPVAALRGTPSGAPST